MKKAVLFLISLLFITNIFAQKIRIGITAGPVLATSTRPTTTVNNTGTANDRTIRHSGTFSFKVGAVASIPISNFIVFRPELTYIGKGWKNHYDYVTETDFNTRMASHWIELPLNFVYNVPAKNGRFFIGLGPYVACALSATLYNAGDSTDLKVNIEKAPSIPPPAGTAYANRFDIGANILAGYEFRNGVFLNLNYSHGFVNFRNDSKTDISNKNIIVGLSIGYMFK